MTRASWKALQKQRFKVCLQRFFRFGIRTGTMSKSLPDATEEVNSHISSPPRTMRQATIVPSGILRRSNTDEINALDKQNQGVTFQRLDSFSSRRDSIQLARMNSGTSLIGSASPLSRVGSERKLNSIMVKRRVSIQSPGGIEPETAQVPLSTIERIRRLQTFEEMLYSVAPAFSQSSRSNASSQSPKKKRGDLRGQAWVQLSFKSQQLESSMTNSNLFMFIFSMLGLAAAIVSNELCFDSAALQYSSSCPNGVLFKLISVGCLLLMDLGLIYYYTRRSRAKMIRWYYSSPTQAFFRSTLWVQFLIELLIFHVQPYPFISPSTDVGIIWGNNIVVAMFFRLYLAARVIHDFSPLFRERSMILRRMKNQSGSIGIPQGVGDRAEVDFSTTLKTYFNLYNLQFLSAAFLILLLGGAYSVHIFERQYFINTTNLWDSIYAPALTSGVVPNSDVYMRTPFADYQSCIWFTIVTACSVGFGDMVPISPGGRTIAGFIMLCGIIIASMLVGTITVLLSPTPFQTAVIDWIKADRLRHEKRQIAAMIIQTVFRDWRARRASRQHAINSIKSPRVSAQEAEKLKESSASGAPVVTVISDQGGELMSGMRRRSVDMNPAMQAVATGASAFTPPASALISSDSTGNLFPDSKATIELPNMVPSSAADKEKTPQGGVSFRASVDFTDDAKADSVAVATSVEASVRRDQVPIVKPILPLVHLPMLKPMMRNLRRVKRMELEHATGSSSSYEQSILTATKSHSDRLKALETSNEKSAAHMEFLEQQVKLLMSMLIAQGETLEQLKELLMVATGGEEVELESDEETENESS